MPDNIKNLTDPKLLSGSVSLGSVRFLLFFKEVSSAHQGCIYSIKNTEKNP